MFNSRDLVERLFERLSTTFGRRSADHWRPSKVFAGMQLQRRAFGLDQQTVNRQPPPRAAVWHRSVAERLMSAFLRRKYRRVHVVKINRWNRSALDAFRGWFEDRTGFRQVTDIEQLFEAAQGLGGREFEVCVDVARGMGWKVTTPEPDESPLAWEWTCGSCGGHRWSAMLPGGLAMCGGCKSAWPIKK